MSKPTSKESLRKPFLAQPLNTPTKKKPVIADSWDDEDLSDNEPAETPDKVPSPPPPTPTTPHAPGHTQNSSSMSFNTSRVPLDPRDIYTGGPDSFFRDGTSGGNERGERPRTTDAVARRLIAGALGVRTRTTKEQKEYDTAMKTAEKKRKDAEKEKQKAEEAERERLKIAIWED